MDLTQFLSQLIGIYVLVASLSALLYPKRVEKALREVGKSYLFPYFDGALALIFGLLIVLVHNVWDGLAASLVTLIGWLAVIEGGIMLLLPQESIVKLAEKFAGRTTAVAWSVAGLAVGGYLTYVGFFAV